MKDTDYQDGYKDGVNNALELMAACYSAQGHNYQQSVHDDIANIRRVLGVSTPNKKKVKP